MYSHLIVFTFVILFIILLLIIMSRRFNDDCDDCMETEFITTTTTTTDYETGLDIVGNLKVKTSGKQRFVIDPVDGDKVYLNSNDDLYEDGAGKIWRLV